jgi:hypothetical protein
MAKNRRRSPKWGQGVLKAYGRKGLLEIQTAGPFGDSPIAAATDPGMPGMATQGEIAQARQEEWPGLEEEFPARAGIGLDDRGRDDRGIDPDL